MPTNDERIYYIRLTKSGFQNLSVSQAFFDARPLVKTPADEDAGTAAVFYSEADNLSYEVALRLYKPHSVACMQESAGEGVAPLNLGILTDLNPLPAECTHVFFALNSPVLQPLEIAALAGQAAYLNIPLNQVLIPWGVDQFKYLESGELHQ